MIAGLVNDTSGELRWRKSSRSSSQGGDCVEVAQAIAELSADSVYQSVTTGVL